MADPNAHTGTQPYSVPPVAANGSLLDVMKRPISILRCLQWFFALVSFSTLASYGTFVVRHSSEFGFAIFTGVTAWLLAAFFFAMSLVSLGFTRGRLFAIVQLGVDAVWTVFWLSAAIALAALGTCGTSEGCARFNAGVTFAFFSVPAWAAAAYLSYVNLGHV